MKPVRGALVISAVFLLPCSSGCLGLALPINVTQPLEPTGETVQELPGAVLQAVTGEPGLLWLAVERRDRPGTVGGFISPLDEHAGGLVLLFDGASTLNREGPLGSAREFYTNFGAPLRDAGFMTWSVVLPEADTPFGSTDLADALDLLDWVDEHGRDALAVDRVYLVGFSAGASMVNLLNLRREVTAAVSIAGFSEPDQFESLHNLYLLLNILFPGNTAISQVGATVLMLRSLQHRETLDVAAHVTEIRNPTLFIHGTEDLVVFVENTRDIETRYREALAEGVVGLPELEFLYVEGGTHMSVTEDPFVRERILEYLSRFEPAGAP